MNNIDAFSTIHEEFAKVARLYPDAIAMQVQQGNDYKRYSYAEIFAESKKIAYVISSLGLKNGDCLALILENRPEWGMVYLGAMFAGATVVPIDSQASIDEVKYFLTDSNCKLLVASLRYFTEFFINIKNLPICVDCLVLDFEASDLKINDFNKSKMKIFSFVEMLRNCIPCALPKVESDSIASILYTSGTTGKPKGVMLSHANFCANFKSIAALKIITRDDNVLVLLPLHHVFPFMGTFIVPLLTGCCATYVSSMKSEVVLKCMRDTGVTVLISVPQIFALFAKSIHFEFSRKPLCLRLIYTGCMEICYLLQRFFGINLAKYVFKKIHAYFGSKLRLFGSGGAKLDVSVAKYFTKLGFDIHEGYGLSETAPLVTFNVKGYKKIGSVGNTVPNVRVKICCPDATGTGEILIQGPNVMSGYLHRHEETSQVFHDGWFYSGDLGYMDQDGYLYIVDRKKEIIVLGSGKNISPYEVEIHYSQSQFIKELCVFDIEEQSNERLVAIIIPDIKSFQQCGEINIYEKIRWELENLSINFPAYKRVRGFIVGKQDLPRTRLGKLKRYLIKEQYKDSFLGKADALDNEEPVYTDVDLGLLSSEICKRVIEILTERLGLWRLVRISDHLELDLGIDSLQRVELFALFEKEFSVKIPDQEIIQVFSVRDLVKLLQKMHPDTNPSFNNKQSNLQNFLWSDYLKSDPSPELKATINVCSSYTNNNSFLFIVNCMKGLLRTLWRMKIKGVEQLACGQNYIFCPNHTSYLDAFIIAAALPNCLKVNTFYLGDQPIFNKPLIKNFVRIMRVIPIDAARYLLDAMIASAYVLRHNHSLVIFPEGERSIDGRVRSFKKGIGILTAELDATIIPTYIAGAFEAWPRSKKFPRLSSIVVSFGAPQKVETLKRDGYRSGAKNDYDAIALGIKNAVIHLASVN